MPEGISTANTNSLALDMIGRKLNQVKHIKISDHPWSLKFIDGEIWSCQGDGVSVYDTALNPVRQLTTGHGFDVALLPGGNVVIAWSVLCEMSKSGKTIHIKR